MRRVAPGAAALALLSAACRGTPNQSVLEPSGPQAHRTAALWWFALAISAAVYVATMGALAWAAWRARRRTRSGEPPVDDGRGTRRVVAGAVAATVAILFAFLVFDLRVGRSMSGAPVRRPITIEVVGHQWWWEVTYADTSVQGRFETANEIHVPVGEPVVLLLSARDVIHSFWVPNLGGKKDLIPGYTQTVWFQADTPGVYRGQCAEFCGAQHAKMALLVVAEPADAYRAWIARSRLPAATPADTLARRGERVFLEGTCPMCHAVQGTPAGSNAGPDLTHVASRRTIAAGSLPNTAEQLARWIVDPQRVKPGSHMPAALPRTDVLAIVAYLRTLR